PAPHLVAKQPELPDARVADGAFHDHAPGGGVRVRTRPGDLDGETTLGQAHLQRSVIEVAPWPALEPGGDGFVHAAVQPDVPRSTCPERDPQQTHFSGW